MNKTIVVSIGIITLGITLICNVYIYFYMTKTNIETRDRLTVCMEMIITKLNKSIEANQPIDAKSAREICG